MPAMYNVWKNQGTAFWLAPLVAALPLIPIFSIRSSPLFLGTLMGNPAHPANWPIWGPLLSAAGVVFDGTLLGYVSELCLILPIYFLMTRTDRFSSDRVITLFTIVGVAVAQLVHILEHFQQPALRAFANSWFSSVLGGVCGLAGGVFFVMTASAHFSTPKKIFSFFTPITLLAICAVAIVWSADLWRSGLLP
jgi:hypothetical protein